MHWGNALSDRRQREPMKSYADIFPLRWRRWNWWRMQNVNTVVGCFIVAGKSSACISWSDRSAKPLHVQNRIFVWWIPLVSMMWNKILVAWPLSHRYPEWPRFIDAMSSRSMAISWQTKNPCSKSQTSAQCIGKFLWAEMKQSGQDVS